MVVSREPTPTAQGNQQTTGKNSGSRKASGLLVPTDRELSEILSSLLPFPALFSFVSRALVLSIDQSINLFPSPVRRRVVLCCVVLCERPTYSHHHHRHHGGSADIVLWRASERRDHDSSVRGMGVRSTDWYGCDSCVCVWERRGAVNVTLSLCQCTRAGDSDSRVIVISRLLVCCVAQHKNMRLLDSHLVF